VAKEDTTRLAREAAQIARSIETEHYAVSAKTTDAISYEIMEVAGLVSRLASAVADLKPKPE